MGRTSANSSGGFSLIELLVALAVGIAGALPLRGRRETPIV